MICDNCKIERLVNDFINNQKFCYHCEYQIKLKKTGQKRTIIPKFCRKCGKEIIHMKNARKRQRTIFCSEECAEAGHKELRDNHWTRKLRKENPWRAGGEGKWNLTQL